MRLFLFLIITTVHAAAHVGHLRRELRVSICRSLSSTDIWTEFEFMRDDMVWPTPNSMASSISSTFGFRKNGACDCDDFHRGVDIQGETGDPVLASYDGKVVKVITYRGTGNKAVVLEHMFASVVYFHEQLITTWYTNYFHLDEQLVSEGDTVAAGDLIGRVGATGVLSGEPHLHHELLLGTRCSLEFALDNPSSNCNSLGVDPHVHPLFIYPSDVIGASSMTLTLLQKVTSSSDGEIRVETPVECPDVNRFEVKIKNTQDGTTRKSHVLDYNLRTGFNPNSTADLDDADTTKPYLKPISLVSIDLIIPTSWVGSKAPYEVFVVKVSNIWQEVSTLRTFGSGDSWCKW
jgi:murein DD-endopeptidase MepM/ murein hydrolase activator NlpD